jgi:hypothetical protein
VPCGPPKTLEGTLHTFNASKDCTKKSALLNTLVEKPTGADLRTMRVLEETIQSLLRARCEINLGPVVML